MGLRTIGVLLHREYGNLFKNRTLIFITILGMVLFLSIYFVIPSDEEEETLLALYMESDYAPLIDFFVEKEVTFQIFIVYDDFIKAVDDNEYPFGLLFTNEILHALQSSEKVEIPFIISPSTADEYVHILKAYLEIFMNELVLISQNNGIPLIVEDITVGKDSLVDEIPLNKLFIPLLIVMIFITEMLGFGNSLMEELESRTILAVMAAPVKLSDFLFSKSILGISLIFFQSLIVLIVTGSVNSQFPTVLLFLFFSAFLIAGLSFLLSSISRDLMTLVSWGLLFMIILIIPVTGVLFPGLHSFWMNFIPTYLLADSLNNLINLNVRWDEVLSSVLILASASVAVFYLGLFFLRRRIQCL